MRKKPNWPIILTAIICGGVLTLIAFVVVNFEYGAPPSVPDMELASILGAAIVGAFTLTRLSR